MATLRIAGMREFKGAHSDPFAGHAIHVVKALAFVRTRLNRRRFAILCPTGITAVRDTFLRQVACIAIGRPEPTKTAKLVVILQNDDSVIVPTIPLVPPTLRSEVPNRIIVSIWLLTRCIPFAFPARSKSSIRIKLIFTAATGMNAMSCS